MQALTRTARSAAPFAGRRSAAPGATFAKRFQSNPPNPGADATTKAATAAGRSNFIPVASAFALAIGALAFFNYRKTGEPDQLGKAMAKSSLPSQKSGGLGKLNPEGHDLAMGGSDKETEHEGTKPPTRRPPSK